MRRSTFSAASHSVSTLISFIIPTRENDIWFKSYYIQALKWRKKYWESLQMNTVLSLISGGPLISAALLGTHIEISASTLISAAPLNAVLIRIVIIFC